MKKLLLSLLSTLLAIPISNAQSWISLGSGTNLSVYSLAEYNGDLWVGGNFTSAGGLGANYIAKWNGSTWFSTGAGMNSQVWALENINGTLYAGGAFTTAGGVNANRVAMWNGTSWQPMGSGMDGTVTEFAFFQGDIYAGGTFSTAGGVAAKGIAKWNGTAWSAVNIPFNAAHNGNVTSLKVYKNELYIGGDFDTVGTSTAKFVIKWDGNAWSPVGQGMDYWVMSLGVYQNELYAGGMFDSAGGVACNRIAKYDTLMMDWKPVGSGLSINPIGPFDGIYTLCSFNNELYAGGAFSTSNSLHDIVKWDGTSWSDGATAMTCPLGFGVQSISVYNYQLHAGGILSTPSGYVAKLDGVIGAPEIPNNELNVSLYPNPANIKSTISYELNTTSIVSVEMYNATGQKITTLINNATQYPGNYTVDIQSEQYAKGVYFIKLVTENNSTISKLILQ